MAAFNNCGGFKAVTRDLSSLASIDLDKACVDPSVYQPVYSGTRRLSLVEIRNSVRDLLGVDNNLNTLLPPESKQGFYNNAADAMKASELFLDSIFELSESIVNSAFSNATSRSQILVCTNETEACARQVLEKLATKAFHRNISPTDVDQLMSVYSSGSSLGLNFEDSLKLSVRAVMTSPHFLYISIDPKGGSVNGVKNLSDMEIANRLSYFLWSSLPDDELISMAKAGSLKSNIDAQVRRMIKSPKATTLIDEFATYWLGLKDIDAVTPNPELFPNFNSELKSDMITETQMLIREVLVNDASPVDLINADYSFLNENLAKHYNVPNVTGENFRKVDMSGTPRRGILGHASVLTLTSDNESTNIIRRGKYIMDRVICSSPPPPPVTLELEPAVPGEAPKTQRERLEHHRSSPACIGCHSMMDPLGFVLENFDPIGGYRTTVNGLPVDSRADFPNGKQFFNQLQLAEDLSQNISFKQCITRELMTFALGRQFAGVDMCHARQIGNVEVKPDKKFSDLVLGIVKSIAFQQEGAQ